jgi:hypothetical protein
METELVVAEPVFLEGRSYIVGEVVDEAHMEAAKALHPNHFRRRAKTIESSEKEQN